MQDTTEKIEKYINENLFLGNQKIGRNVSFIDSGVIDSIGIMELVNYVEKTFNFKINDEELMPENFDNIESLSHFVHRKKNGE